MRPIVWTPEAVHDLEEIAWFIAVRDRRAVVADRLVEAIHKKVEQYGRQPEMGSIHADLEKRFRVFTHSRYVVVYEPVGEGIVVHRVVDGARDLRRLMR